MGILESIFGIWENVFFYSYKLYFSYICAHVRGPAQAIYLSLLASSEMGLILYLCRPTLYEQKQILLFIFFQVAHVYYQRKKL